MIVKEKYETFIWLLANSNKAKEIYNLWDFAKSHEERDLMSLCELQFKLTLNATLSDYIKSLNEN